MQRDGKGVFVVGKRAFQKVVAEKWVSSFRSGFSPSKHSNTTNDDGSQ